MNDMPWMFHFDNADELAEPVARELFNLGAVVIADPNHLPEGMLNLLVSVSKVEGETVRATIHEVDWTVELDWNLAEPDDTARNLFCLLDSPSEMFDSLDALPEGTPARVVEWLELDDEDEEA